MSQPETSELLPAVLVSARRQLSPNVVCMFGEDRPPVINPPRRGRYPRNVVKHRFWLRSLPGADATVRYGRGAGQRVRLVRFIDAAERERLKIDPNEKFWFVCECAEGVFELTDGSESRKAVFHSKELRIDEIGS